MPRTGYTIATMPTRTTDPYDADASYFRGHPGETSFVRRLSPAEIATGQVPTGCWEVKVWRVPGVSATSATPHVREFLPPGRFPSGAARPTGVRRFGLSHIPSDRADRVAVSTFFTHLP
jgi:hypothetical protein